MANLQQAPAIKHTGIKNRDTKGWGKAIRTHELEMCIMCGLGERDFVPMKIMLFLTGNADDGSFRVAEKTIMERCNISETSYKNARKKLVSMGWITHDAGKSITVNYDAIYNSFKGDTNNTPSTQTQKIKGDTDNTPSGYTNNTSSGDIENTHNNIRNNITKYDNVEALSTPYGDDKSSMKPVEEEVSKPEAKEESKCGSDFANPIIVSREWLLERYNQHEWVNYSTINVFKWNVDGNFYKIGHPSNLRA